MADHDEPAVRSRPGPPADQAMAIVRSRMVQVRSLVRRTVDRPAGDLSEEAEARIRHLETALEQAYERIEALEGLAREAMVVSDHQGARLESLQAELQRARATVDRTV